MKTNVKGIVDEPNPKGGEDTLGISRHAESLTHFMRSCQTPITIGIQGEWGSGKTSLLNSIYDALEKDGIFFQIWINAWEHSLLRTPEEALLNITNEIIKGMLDADSDKKMHEQVKKAATAVFAGALRIGATATMGAKAGEVTDELLASQGSTIKDLRKQLLELSKEVRNRESNPYKKLIIYVDDLDRIEPRDAVIILELLKNIFSVPGCVFVLAIDYQVVVKGLEAKFGQRTEENEWEFRAFFDKIIQLPFMMPMSQYNIGQYVSGLLANVGYTEGSGLDEDVLQSMIEFTIGGNPRSLKRLVNSIALISIFMETATDDGSSQELEARMRLLLFGLVCLQITAPKIHELLTRYPEFVKWDAAVALEETRLKEEEDPQFAHMLENTKATGHFSEEWQEVLFRICYANPRLRTKAVDISQFFGVLRSDVFSKDKEIPDGIQKVIGFTAVTSVNTTDQSQGRKGQRDRTKYTFGGQEYVKARLVHAVLAAYVAQHSDIDFEGLKEAFPDTLQGSQGVFTKLEAAEEIIERTGHRRHYVKPDEVIQVEDAKVAVSTQWGLPNITSFLQRAKEMGMEIS